MRVLLVDDHALFLEGLQNLLLAHEIEVAGTARDGIEALEKARALRPDVILMDVDMPRCDGVTATRLIKAELPETQIVMLTVSADDDDLFGAIKSGASGYLLKNLDAQEFFRLLAALERGEAPISPGLTPRILQQFAGHTGKTKPHDANATASDEREQETGTLTGRQVEVLALVAQGLSYREVGEALCLSERAIKYHMGEIAQRLHLKNRSQVVAYAARQGLIRSKPHPEQS